MKISKYFVISLFCVLIVLLCLHSLLEKKRAERNILKDREFILKERLKYLTVQRREIINFGDIVNFSDSVYSSLEVRIEKAPTLVLMIPEKQCSNCIIQEYKKLRELPNSVQEDIVFLANYTKIRDLKLFLNFNKLDYPAYNSSTPIFDKFQNIKNPILFILDSSLIPQHVFIPISFMPNLTDEYLDFISSNYFITKQQDKRARIKVDVIDNECDFGEVNLNETVGTRFGLQNISDTPLLITDVKSDCGCTVVDWDRRPIQEGEKAFVQVLFNPQKKGFFAKKIYVFSNASNSPLLLIIKGKVQD